MPPKFESLSELLLVVAGGILMWLGGVLKDWFRESTKKRRERVDEVARLELSVQEHREVIYAMRTEMLKSGEFKPEDLPPIPRKR